MAKNLLPQQFPDVMGQINVNGRPHTLFSDGTLLPLIRGGATEEEELEQQQQEEQQLPLGADDEIVIPIVPEPPAEQQPAPSADLLKDPAVKAAIEKARKEEKDKLYPKIEEQDKFLKELKAERAAAQKAAEKAAKDAEAARKAQELEEMTAAERIAAYQQEMDTRIAAVEAERQAERAIFEQERAFQALQSYATQRLAAEQGDIMPQLRDLIGGSTEEEIEASIALAKERTASILADVAAHTQGVRQQQKGVSATAPPVGPMENDSTYQTLTPADIAGMDMNEYAKNRKALLGAVSQKARSQGLYGG